MAIPYSKLMLIQRIQTHWENNFPNSDMSLTNNQTLLYVDQVLASNMIGQVYAGAKLEGNIAMPEAYISTYSISNLTKDPATNYWYGTLPQPPVSLPLGYSITDAYFASSVYGIGDPILPIENKRVSYRKFMPLPTGTRYWVEGQTIYLQASNGNPLSGQTLYVKMAKSRTTDVNEPMNLPDDAIDAIFNGVIKLLANRLQMPQDVIEDQLPAGNKGS